MKKIEMQVAVLMAMAQHGMEKEFFSTRENCRENNFAYWEKFSTQKSKVKKKKNKKLKRL